MSVLGRRYRRPMRELADQAHVAWAAGLVSTKRRELDRSCAGCGAGPYEACDGACGRVIA